MHVEYETRNGKLFKDINKGIVFEKYGVIYMKIEQVIHEKLSVKNKYNAVSLITGDLEYFSPDDSVNCIETKLVICDGM